MTKNEAIRYIESLSSGLRRKSSAPLDNPGRTRVLLSSVGNPDRRLRFVHVCGSNGKGSVCAILDSILRSAGYRVGLFTSPHLQDFCERIRVNGKMIGGRDLADLTERLSPAAESLPDKPGLFCFVTALALTYFAEQRCDIVILETGLGGTHDATNVIEHPDVAVVTNIGLEHTEILGSTVREITFDKGGIIKTGCICAAYDGDPEATAVLREICTARHVPLQIADFASIRPHGQSCSLQGQTVTVNGTACTLSLPGSFQVNNAALALTAVDALTKKGWIISDESVRRGLKTVRWPARFEVLSREPLIILDGGHNPQCARALTETVDQLFPDRKVIFLVGIMKDKNYRETLQILAPKAERFLCVTPPDPRGIPADELSAYLLTCGAVSEAFDSARTALSSAVKGCGNAPVIIFGSLYLAGEIRDLMGLTS